MTSTLGIFEKAPSILESLIEYKMREKKSRVLIPKIGPRHMFPGNIERKYMAELSALVSSLIEITRSVIYPKLESIAEEAKNGRHILDAENTDDFSDDIASMIEESNQEFEQKYPDILLVRKAAAIAAEIAVFNRNQIMKVLRQMIGVDVFLSEPWLETEIKAFVGENVALIKTIESRHFADIEQLVYRSASQGLRHEEIQRQIIQIYGKTRNIAKRIGRDQVNKFNGQLTMIRQTNLGVKQYVWKTMGDERVRGRPGGRYPGAVPSHWARQNKTFYWNKPPDGGHPGQAIQCRCWPEPVLQDIIDKINQKKQSENE